MVFGAGTGVARTVLFGNDPHAVTTAEDFAKEGGCIFIFDQSKRTARFGRSLSKKAQ